MDGIDVSNWQGVVDWHSVKASGKTFAGIKATEGSNIIDADFAANWAGARAAGLARIAYCFTRPEQGDPAAQAAWFVQTVNAHGGFEVGDLAAGDFETPDGTADESAFALGWLGATESAIGFKPLLYCAEYWASSRLTDARLARYPLWLACLDPATLPASIGVWKSVALRQNSWTLSVPGIGGNVDGDELARNLDGLKALGKPAPQPPTLTLHRVAVPGDLKQSAGHTSPSVPDPAHPSSGYNLPVGTQVTYIGGTQTVAGEVWQKVSVTKPVAQGWFLAKSLT